MPKKIKEDRSDWVAVEPEFSNQNSSDGVVKKASSAYQFFQRDVSGKVRDELLRTSGGTFDIAAHGRAVRERWNNLSEEEKESYFDQARADQLRYKKESHAADIAALERREKMQREHNQVLMYDEGSSSSDEIGAKRSTRRYREDKKREKKVGSKHNAHLDDDDAAGSGDSDSSNDEDDDSSNDAGDAPQKKKKSKKKQKSNPPKRVATQKQIEYREKIKKEKQEKESYISDRNEDLQKERTNQAKRRLEFLLKQSNIFSHFGQVKADTVKFGIKKSAKNEENESSESAIRRGSTSIDDDEDDKAKALEEADEHEATFLTQQPSTLGFGQMRQYQIEGLNWMIRLQENGVNGILADEMGLGKTLQSISVLVYMQEYRNDTGPHLVIVPKSTLSNWMNEFARWAPTLKTVKFHGGRDERDEFIKTVLEPGLRDENRTWNVLVTTYEIINIEKTSLLKFAWSYLIVDEAHRLKNEASVFSKTVRMFHTRYRILLTGTPLQNSLHELWALLNFLVPDVFASAEQFDEWFNLDIDDDDEKNKLISQLHKILRPFMLRRLKADVEKSLPPKHETILFTGMSALQKKLYRDILIRDLHTVQGSGSGGIGSGGGGGSRTAILNIVMQLRKCAGHPYLFPGVEDRTLPPLGEHLVENCGKMVVLDKLLKRLNAKGHRVLLFTQMTKILDLMEDYLVMRKFKYCRIDGNTSYDDRENYIELFNAPNSEKFLFLLSTRAGGLGINLQTADTVILYDSDWNPQADLQAQDRAHRIGQKRPVQVFRLVTEHTVEEKIVERAQQKLKLDAMVVQSGRLKDKDTKLSREELLAAVRFGADKIFRSKDSSITDDDIDMIMDAGIRKTQALNEKLMAADKGDLLDFKLDGSSVQTFEGVDYSKGASSHARSDPGILSIFDIGKRERKEANYNENSLYQRQITALQGERKPKPKKSHKLPKHFRLPRMEEWQMYDRDSLLKIQEEEEALFKELPEDVQKAMIMKDRGEEIDQSLDTCLVDERKLDSPDAIVDVPQLLSDEKQAEKERLLKEGFIKWSRHDYTIFVKASAKHGRDAIDKIALEVAKPENEVQEYAAAFWGDTGKARISEHEYDRVVKLIERGEKKIGEVSSLERATKILVSHFDNPWKDLEFAYVNCKDKMFTVDEDRHLLCWSRKYGYGQWFAIRLAIRRNPLFRFNYFLRSLPIDLLARRCEQLMKAAEKEVEHLERKAREMTGLPTDPLHDGDVLPPVEIPKFRVMQQRRELERRKQSEEERKELEKNVADIEAQIKHLQDRLKSITDGTFSVSASAGDSTTGDKFLSRSRNKSISAISDDADATTEENGKKGALGPGGKFLEFPPYDGIEHPSEWKKPFTHFCNQKRKEIKAELDPLYRKDKSKINNLLKERWSELDESEKIVYREWTEWDKKRYTQEMMIFQNRRNEDDDETEKRVENAMQEVHIPKKRKNPTNPTNPTTLTIPKKNKT